jgi:murein DD-endopeptidase MepM/ murein hydrolase activator NlpD
MKRWHMLLGTAFGPWVIALAYVLLVQGHTAAYNTYVNEYRKWPWRAGVEHYISTCPDQGQHQGQLWADDIDVAGSFPVHSASSRGIVAFNDWDSRGTGGWMLVIQEQDGLGYWVHYLHLAERAIFPTETQIVQGQRVATSGGTGGYEPHLHFGMSPCVYYDCASITIYPIAGFADSGSCTNAWYPSDNAGIGDMCGPPWPCEESTTLDGTYYSDFTEQYQDHGGYDWVGVTWDPYGYRVHWWVYPWSAGGYSGVAQNFIGGVIGQGAIMQGEGLDAFWVWGDFWYAYATGCAGTDNWAIYYIGYPIEGRHDISPCTYGLSATSATPPLNAARMTAPTVMASRRLSSLRTALS